MKKNIKTKRGLKKFFRAGLEFSEQDLIVDFDDLTKEQVERLSSEENLVITDIAATKNKAK